MDSTSKVTVEYSDPSRTYHSVALELEGQLPLKGLHWKSLSGLRSIPFLHVEFLPDRSTSTLARPQSNESSSDNQPNGPTQKKESPKKERRHQIPGLRRTPYLKIYLLDCKDVDTYRQESRKQLREWVKDHTKPSQSSVSLNKQENHDAFEWLIVHVVASPADGSNISRPSSSAKGDSNAERRPSSSRWPSRGSTTSVIEKVRADFNGTSKNAVDRVVQVHLAERSTEDSGQPVRPTPEGRSGWDDLIAKMKTFILASFDLRVGQYEEDIKEKELQKTLPGWNFNTFFVLKEGLARGFESVGLIEDALTGYHELALGLNAVIDEQSASCSNDEQTASFSEYTEELYEEFKHAANCNEIESGARSGLHEETTSLTRQEAGKALDLGASILDTERKPFRDLILANSISVFDFQCYVFARQISLLLRLANKAINTPENANGAIYGDLADRGSTVSTATRRLSSAREDPEDLLVLADVCQRASDFITLAAPVIREDIRHSIQTSKDGLDWSSNLSTVIYLDLIEKLVASWTFSATQCILEATSTPSLSVQIDPLLRQLKSSTATGVGNNGAEAADVLNIVHRKDLPDRTSSLPSRIPTATRFPVQEGISSITTLDAVRLLPPVSSHPGAQELAAHQGELFSLARRVLSSLAFQCGGWQGGLAALRPMTGSQEDSMQDVNLGEGSDGNAEKAENHPLDSKAPTLAGVRNKILLAALCSKSGFSAAYEDYTSLALACYVIGDRKNMAEENSAALALIRFQNEDYSAAASLLHQLAPFYAKNDWSDLEVNMLDVYARCLRQLGKTEEFVRIGLRTLAKKVQSTVSAQERLLLSPSSESKTLLFLKATGFFKDLLVASKSLDQRITVSIDEYFDQVDLDPYIRHSSDHDGFQLLLRFRSRLSEHFYAHSIQVKIVTTGQEQRCDLSLSAETNQMVKPGVNQILVSSRVMLPALYIWDSMTIQAENIIFTYDLSPPANVPLFASTRDSVSVDHIDATKQHRLLIWPQPQSLTSSLACNEIIHLERPRSIKVEIFSGWNYVYRGKLTLRAASAGLRLHTAEAEVVDGDSKITDKSQSGTIGFSSLAADSIIRIKLPYGVESDLREISVRLEVSYTTENGDFTYSSNPKLSISLPLAVNVQDTFKLDGIFSRFTIGTATFTPLRISKCYVKGNSDFDVISPSLGSSKLDVFVRQPLSLIAKIQRASRSDSDLGQGRTIQRRLYLHIEYRCLEEEIFKVVEASLVDALESTPYRIFASLLKHKLLAILRSRLSIQDLEGIGLSRELTLGSFEEYSWDSILARLSPDNSEDLMKWLRKWHEDHPTLSLEIVDTPSPVQYLTVPVDLPQMQIVFTALLRHLNEPTYTDPGMRSVAIGQGLAMQLTIKHTRKWSSEDILESEHKLLEFTYEVQANPDAWLIGGARKAHFKAKEDEVLSFSLLLIPQRLGSLLYPSVEIGCSHKGGQSEAREPSAAASISCETDYQNQADTILVVPDMMSTTVSLDPGSSVGGAWLIDTTNRSATNTGA